MMQAFAYHHLVPTDDLWVSVRGGAMLRTPIQITTQQPLEIPAGGTARFQVHVPPSLTRVQFELSEPPEGIGLRQDGTNLVLQCDAAKAKPGLKGNLIVTISGERVPQAANAKQPPNRQRVALGTLPALPFEIVARRN
jgi:hypothetical protein